MGLPEERRPRDRPPGGPASSPPAAAALVATTALLASFSGVGASSGEAAIAFISYLLAPSAGIGSGGLGVSGDGRSLAFISSLFSPLSDLVVRVGHGVEEAFAALDTRLDLIIYILEGIARDAGLLVNPGDGCVHRIKRIIAAAAAPAPRPLIVLPDQIAHSSLE